MSRYDVDWDEMEDLRVVAPFFDELRTQFVEGPAPQIGTELATLFVFGAPPVGVVNPPKPAASPRHNVRRVAAGAIGGLALVAGMGAAGALPGPIQEPVARAAELVGLNLPHPHHHHHTDPAGADTRGSDDRSPSVTTHGHHATHVPTESPDESTVLSPAGSPTPSSGGSTSQSGSTTRRSGSGASTSTGNSSVTGSGSAVSSTSSGGGSNGTNQTGDHHPRYHGNGRTTRDGQPSSSTSTTAPPASSDTTTPPSSDSGSGGGSSTPPDTTPTTTAPS